MNDDARFTRGRCVVRCYRRFGVNPAFLGPIIAPRSIYGTKKVNGDPATRALPTTGNTQRRFRRAGVARAGRRVVMPVRR